MPPSTQTLHQSSASPSLSSASPSLSSAGTGTSTPTLSDSFYGDSTHQPPAQILVLYHKATSTFLLRQLATAYSTSLEALELLARTNQEYGLDHSDNISTRRTFFVMKQKLWILHTTIFGAVLSDRTAAAAVAAGSERDRYRHHQHHKQQQQQQQQHPSSGRGIVNGVKKRISGSSNKDSSEKLVKDLWRRLVEDYGGQEGDVDGQVMVLFTLLCINQKLYALARQIVESYLGTIPEGMLIHLETAAGVSLDHSVAGGQNKDPLMTNYERLVELYLIHVLAKLSEWDYAAEFLQYNSILSDSCKKTYRKILDRLHEKSLRPKKTVSATKKQIASDAEQFGTTRSLLNSGSPSGASTSISSPTLSSASTMDSLAGSQTLEPRTTVNGSLSHKGLPSLSADVDDLKASVSSLPNNSARTKMAVVSEESIMTPSTSELTVSWQGRMMLLLQHYVDLIKNASKKMGTSQLMIVVGLVVFLGTVSRNRTRASAYLKTGMAKVMDTVKMGTTVTSI